MSLKRQYAEFVAQEKAGAILEAKAAAEVALTSEHSWFYEASGSEQGPFGLDSMKQWFQQGYFQMNVRVRRGPDKDFFPLSSCPEIAGGAADPRTAEQWKERGNSKLVAGDAAAAIDCYSAGLATCRPELIQEADQTGAVLTAGGAELANSERTMCGVLFSNRSGAYLQIDKAAEAEADARRCAKIRPNWGKAQYRLGAALMAQSKFADAVLAADLAEKLEPVALYTKLKMEVLVLLKAVVSKREKACHQVAGTATGADSEPRDKAATDEHDAACELVRRFADAEDDTVMRVRRREIKLQEEREDQDVTAGIDGSGEAYRKETPSEYAARRDRLVKLEKINRGELPPEAMRDEEEEQEHMDYVMAMGKQGMTSIEQAARLGSAGPPPGPPPRGDKRRTKMPEGLRSDGEDRLWGKSF